MRSHLQRPQALGVVILAAVFTLGIGSSWASGGSFRAHTIATRVLQIRPTFAPLIASSPNGISVVAMGVRSIPPGWVMQVGATGDHTIVRRRTGATIKFLGGGVTSGPITIRVTRPRTATTVWLGYYRVFTVTNHAIMPTERRCITAVGKLHSLPCPRPTTRSTSPGAKTTTSPGSPTPTTITTTTTTTTTAAPPPPAQDTSPPSAPAGLSVSNVSMTTLRLNYSASTDNVGVTGYNGYLNGAQVGSTSNLYVDFTGLACGTTYTLGVSAYDAAGNTSGQSSTTAATSACPPPPTYYETTGGVTHTWTNYTNAGGTEGPSIGSNSTVQIACRLTGWTASDGNNWWYRIAASPWNSSYYASADAFYNNGATSGSLLGTPFYDPNVPVC